MTSIVEKNLSERFEIAFNQIHSWLRKNIKGAHSDKFSELLKNGFPQHSIIRKNYHDLKMFARLRNSIVHEKIGKGFYIAEPHEKVVVQIENIASLVFQPKNALLVGSKPVVYYDEHTKLLEVLSVIKNKPYSIFPIYDQRGFKWLLTAESIIQWLAQNLSDKTIHLNHVLVKDLEGISKPRPVEFVGRETDMFEVEEIFEDYHQKNRRLEAVVITATGKKTETPLAIITPRDLVEMDTIV
ncbi:CBS domain-containing protein [Niallia sp. Krafla_26]|uniref:CBS domain-containing protein n=1 Tax=Niallia sp. Krafla_26 TaxID=3064703 RepID=UPI003D174EE5